MNSSAESSVPARLPGRGERVEAPGHRARLLHRWHRQPDRPGRDLPSSSTGTATSPSTPSSEPDERAGRDRVQRVHRHVEQRVGGEGHERQQRGGGEREQAERRACADGGPPAGLPASSRPRAPPAPRRSCSPTRWWRHRSRARAGARPRSRRPASPSRPRKRAAAGAAFPTGTIARVAPCRRTLLAADRAHLWHPFTQQRGWSARGAADRRARRGLRADRHRGPALHRRRLVAVVHRPRPPPPAHRRRGARAARPRGALHHARPHPPAGAIELAAPPGGDRPRGPHARASTPTAAPPPPRSR